MCDLTQDAQPGDQFFFYCTCRHRVDLKKAYSNTYFVVSGHSTQDINMSGTEEDGKDECKSLMIDYQPTHDVPPDMMTGEGSCIRDNVSHLNSHISSWVHDN